MKQIPRLVLAKNPATPLMKIGTPFLFGLSIWENANLVLHQIKMMVISA